MKNRILGLTGLCIFVMLLLCMCSKEEHRLQNEVPWKKVYTKWGANSSKVRSRMQNYSLMHSTNDILYYKGKNDTRAIVYKFVDDSLCASVVIADAERIGMDEVRSSFSSYESLGESDSNELFINVGQNTLVTIANRSGEAQEYISIGYAAIE